MNEKTKIIWYFPITVIIALANKCKVQFKTYVLENTKKTDHRVLSKSMYKVLE